MYSGYQRYIICQQNPPHIDQSKTHKRSCFVNILSSKKILERNFLANCRNLIQLFIMPSNQKKLRTKNMAAQGNNQIFSSNVFII